MTTFLLIRHAASEGLDENLAGRSTGVCLTEQGRQQARHLAGELAHLQLDRLYTSPLQRCCETAEALAAVLGCPIYVEEDLNEIDFGKWTGRSFANLNDDPAWQLWNTSRSSACSPHGESMVEAQARLMLRLGQWSEEHPEQTIVALSHADMIKAAIAHCRGESLDTLLDFEVTPASVTIIAWNRARPSVLLVNGTGREAAELMHSTALT